MDQFEFYQHQFSITFLFWCHSVFSEQLYKIPVLCTA